MRMTESLLLPLLAWYLVVQIIGLAGLPFCQRLFSRLPDRGYSFSKSLGLLLAGYVYWAGYAFGLWANAFPGAWAALLATAAAAGWWWVAACRSRNLSVRGFLADAWQAHRRYVFVVELLFLLSFVLWAWVRMEVPGVRHTEQFRNIMFLSGLSNNLYYPPGDPWLSGFPICYYYFAYWVELFPARLIGMPADVTFNVGQACWLALLVVACFGMGYNLIATRAPVQPPARSFLPYCGGMLSVLCVALASNAKGVVDAWKNRGEFFWWWGASRAVTDQTPGGPVEIITEFPIFSYILGDNHPHVLVMPFVLLCLAAAFQILLPRDGSPPPRRSNGLERLLSLFSGSPGVLLLVMLLPASVFAMNSWDYPTVCAVLVCACLFGFPGVRQGTTPALLLAGLLLLALPLFFLPYLLTSQSMFEGLVRNRIDRTDPAELFGMFGLFVPGLLSLAAFFVSELLHRNRAPGTPRASVSGAERVVAGHGGAVPETGAPRRPRNGVSIPTGSACMLALAGLGLVVLPEWVYVLDVFESRMNTIFKLYYQAWLLLGLASAHGLTLLLSKRRLFPAGLFGVLIVCAGLLYPARAIHSRAQESGDPYTLDSSAWLAAFAPDERAAVEWIRTNTQPDDVLAEAPGTSYDVGHNRASTLTGRATLLGWQGHVLQFRGKVYDRLAAGRPEALQTIYLAADRAALASALHRFRIRYVYLGPHERAAYGVTREQEETLDGWLDVVFQQGAVKLYRFSDDR